MKLLGYRTLLTSINIPEGVKIIGNEAFMGCSALTTIHIPDSVNSIGDRAFERCSSLTSIHIPDSVISIGNGAFSDTGWYNVCPNGILYLDNCLIDYKKNKPTGEVKIKSGTRVLAKSVFSHCSSLTSIHIPDSVTSIGEEAFMSCSSLTFINVDNTNNYYTSDNGVLFDKNKTTIICYPGGKIDSSYNIPSRVNNIGNFAFYHSSLTAIHIPDSVKSIGDSAFENCSNLTTINIPDSVISIEKRAFMNCEKLKSIFIPKSVKNIGECVFCGCGNFISIKVEKHNRFYDSRNDCNAIIETKSDTLIAGCSASNIPNITHIATPAFSGREGLEFISIPEGVVDIGNCSFRGCKDLKTIKLPSTITHVGYDTFDHCPVLTSIVIPNGTREKFEKLLPHYKNKLVEQQKHGDGQ